MKKYETIILGAGIAGLSAGHTLQQLGKEVSVFEKNEKYGGLCRSFTIDGFTFDTFAHVAFSKNAYINEIFEDNTPYFTHVPEATNYYKGTWIRNPAQNNLIDLPIEERIKTIEDFITRDKNRDIKTYDDWLVAQYGEYFTRHFPTLYTKKYWTVEPKELEPRWVEGRMYAPSLQEILRGAMTRETPNVHYTKEVHYPKTGGFESFLKPLSQNLEIHLNKEVIHIDSKKKEVLFSDETVVSYDNLISTIPLDILVPFVDEPTEEIRNLANDLDYTSGIMVSIGLKCENVAPQLWFYIYDEDIYPARVYAPNMKSPNNVPLGCCALQAEIYYSKKNPQRHSLEEIEERTVEQLIQMNLIKKEDIIILDTRVESHANIMFTPQIYETRAKLKTYLSDKNIICAGRFGEWDYLWSDQSILSGKAAAEKIIEWGK